MFKRKASITNRILRIFLIATLILLPTATLAESYNPFSWFSKKINPKGKYTLVFLDESKPDMLVKLKKREEGYNLLVTNLETMETIIIKCGELQDIIEKKPVTTTVRVGLGALFAAAAIAVFTYGAGVPIAAAILGGSGAYISRGKSPAEFCIK